jgi:glycosyltransferase involved in cell wall biosynthesis
MFSVVIATNDSERALVATLAALVPGATAGVVREVIVADGGSHDETEQVADIAGCRFCSSAEPLGARLSAAAAMARGEWLMFLAPGIAPQPGWIDDTIAFVRQDRPSAAVFSPAPSGILARMRRTLARLPGAEQGLVLRKTFYAQLGGHRSDAGDPEADFLRRIGRARLTMLRATIAQSNI